MCQRRTHVKKHFACFACRKGFKQPGSLEWEKPETARPFPCPECGEPMYDMGADFRAPRQRDARQWIKVEILHGFGIVYHPGCCDGPGRRPAELTQVVDFLATQGHDPELVRKRIEATKQLRRA